MRILKQEPKNIFSKTSFDVDDKWLYTILQKNIREEFWCKFKSEQFEIYMGYDFYLHINSMYNIEEFLKKTAKKHNLYYEKCDL